MAKRIQRSLARGGSLFLLSALLVSCGGAGDTSDGEGIYSSILAVSNDATRLADGGVQLLDFNSSQATVTLNDDAASYLLVVTSPARSKRSFSASLQNQNVKRMGTSEWTGGDMHQYMREIEPVLAREEDADEPSDRVASKAMVKPLTIGETREFKVLSTLGSISSYTTVTAKLRRISDVSLVYVDIRAERETPGDLTDAEIENLASGFDDVAVPWERSVYGSESDVDGDGKMTILMTPVLNEFQGTGGGIVTGFFFPGDVFAPSSSNPASNHMEIFYTLVPDTEGVYGVPIDPEFTLGNLLPGVLAHEYEHMISYNQHVLLRRSSAEEAWLNEALAHFTEDVTGFGKENPSRAQLYLNSIGSTSIVPGGSPNLAERGGGYLFLRYLYEQSDDPDGFFGRLLQTSLTGVANLESAFEGPTDFNELGEFLQRFGVAIAVSEMGLTSDPRFNFAPRQIHPQTGYLTGICLRCDPEDGRQTILSGPKETAVTTTPTSFMVPAAGIQILKVSNPPVEISISGEADATLSGAIVRTPS